MSVHDRYREFVPDQREFFDALISEDWDSYHSEEWDETRRYEVAELFARIQPKNIVDVGCGCGFHDQEMARYPFVEKVVGLDYSAKSIDAANTHYPHEKVERIVADLTKLDAGAYDLVVSWQVFEHLDDPRLYFDSAVKVLNRGGWLVIFTPNRMRLRNAIRRLKGQPVEYCDPQHFYEYVPAEIKKIAQGYGLEFADSFGYGMSGLRFIDRMPNAKRLRLGKQFPAWATLFCVMFRKP